MDTEILEIAAKAVRLYAETHPRPPHVNMTQAADMLGCGLFKVRSMLRNGNLTLNECGLIPITQIDRAIAERSPKSPRDSLRVA